LRISKIAMSVLPILVVSAVFLVPSIQQGEFTDTGSQCQTYCPGIPWGGYPAWVSPAYAYLGLGTVYVANVNDTAHVYCWHAGNPNLTDEPGSPSYVCGVPMICVNVPAPL
jgi:hypothetical protein